MAKHIYCHIPFCAAKCPYCDFYSEAGRDSECVSRLIEAMCREISSYKADDVIYTIYIGGGTPSFIDPAHIARLLDTIRGRFTAAEDCEITIEVNPSSLTEDKALKYKAAGVNRVSVGVQSLHDKHLATLGRLHDASKAIDCINILKETGFGNISADLIIAVPGQSTDDALEDLNTLAGMGVKHISTYSLSIEHGTPFFARYGDTIEDLVPPEEERRMYHTLRSELERLGYIPYEISNSCRPGYESRHNSSYWEGEEYYGIGAGAHGYVDGIRYAHPDDIDSYIGDPFTTETEEVMDEDSAMHEYPFLKLRTSEGVDLKEFAERFGREFTDVFGEIVRENVNKGLLTAGGGHVRLTDKGIDWSNAVMSGFL